MNINRKRTLDNLEQFALGGGGVVVGTPGVGKTHFLKALSRKLNDQHIPFVFLPVDKLAVRTEPELSVMRGGSGNLINDLDLEWRNKGKRLGVVIIDGFDAARSEDVRTLYLGIIRRILMSLPSKWSVIVSVRTYDALKSLDLLDLFPQNQTKEVRSAEVDSRIHCRNFVITLLTEEETKEAVQSIPRLPALYDAGSPVFRALLHTPFNLWLMEKLLEDGNFVLELSAVSSEVQLLELFWAHRVDTPPHREAKRQLLIRAVKNMTEEKWLSARREDVFLNSSDNALEDLLSSETLSDVESNGQRLAFSHNILFDYAVTMLLMEESAARLLAFLKADVSRAIFLRPSIQYYFTRLWYFSPKLFWSILWEVFSTKDPAIEIVFKIVPPSVAVLESQKIDDLKPLIERHLTNQTDTADFILCLLQAHNALDVKRDHLWIEFARTIGKRWEDRFSWDLATLLEKILSRPDQQEITRKACGGIVRDLFDWIWKRRPSAPQKNQLDYFASAKLIPLITATYSTDLNASREIVSRVLSLLNEPGFSIQYFFRLTDGIEDIIKADPQTAAKIYEAVLIYDETSKEVTDMGTRVLRLTSTRRQDFDSCKYKLKESAPEFVSAAPEYAFPSLIRCISHYIESESVKSGMKTFNETFSFQFLGVESKALPDGSHLWGTHYRDEELLIADSLFDHIRKVRPVSKSILELFAREVPYAFFWAQLLRVGCENAADFKGLLLPLCIARPIQIGSDTVEALSEYLRNLGSSLTDEELKNIEDSILANADKESDFPESWLRYVKKRLLLSLPKGRLRSESSKSLVSEVTEKEKAELTQPLFKVSVGYGKFDEERQLAPKGNDLEDPADKALKEHWEALEEFYAKWLNGRADADSVQSIIPVIRQTYTELQNNKKGSQEVIDSTWTKLGATVSRVARSFNKPSDESYGLIREIVLDLTSHRLPEPDPESDPDDDSSVWLPVPRIYAAESLGWLARFGKDSKLIEAIQKLANDPTPQVRAVLFGELFRIFQNQELEFWQIIEAAADTEKNPAAIQVLAKAVYRVAGVPQPAKLESVLAKLIKAGAWKNTASASETLSAVMVGVAIAKKNNFALRHIEALLKTPVDNAAILHQVVLQLTSFITPETLASEKNRDYVPRAIEWINKCIDAAWEGLAELGQSNSSKEWGEEATKAARELIQVSDVVVSKFYFALESKEGRVKKDKVTATSDSLRAYYFEIKPVLELILKRASQNTTVGIFSPTAHHFMEMLNIVLPFDPPGVVLLVNSLLDVSKRDGYQFDQMAVREMVKLTDTVLANHRAEMRDPKVSAALLNILGTFVNVGWPEASRLVWRLDEIFR